MIGATITLSLLALIWGAAIYCLAWNRGYNQGSLDGQYKEAQMHLASIERCERELRRLEAKISSIEEDADRYRPFPD